MIDCIVLAGGLGTRLRSVVSDVPKPLAQIVGVPFLSLLLHSLASTRFIRKVVIAVSYKAEAIIDFISSQSFPIPVEFSREEEPYGTGGAVKKAFGLTSSECILVMNGDSYLEFSLEKLLQQHLKNNFDATLVYTHVEDTSRFGLLEVEANRAKSFREKKAKKEPGLINTGVYLFDKHIFDLFAFPEKFSLEHDLFPQLIRQGMGAFRTEGQFIDIGTPESYLEAQTVLQPLVHNL